MRDQRDEAERRAHREHGRDERQRRRQERPEHEQQDHQRGQHADALAATAGLALRHLAHGVTGQLDPDAVGLVVLGGLDDRLLVVRRHEAGLVVEHHRDDPEGAVVGDRARLRIRWLYGGHVVEPGQVVDERVDLVAHRVHATLGLDDDRHGVALLLGHMLGVRVDQLLRLGARQAEVVAVVVAGHGRSDGDRDQGHQPEHDGGPVVALRPRRQAGHPGVGARE